MAWILLFVIAASLVALSFYNARIGFISLGVLLALFIAFYFIGERTGPKPETAELDKVSLANTSMTLTYADGFAFAGRVQNDAQSMFVREIVVRSTMLDCESEQAQNCTTIGEMETRIFVSIPPGQARDVRQTINFGEARPVGVLKWRHEIVSARMTAARTG